jgi:putative ABC transport system permease protein
MATLLLIAWRNLWRGWRRSAVVVGSVAIGLAAALLLVAWSHGWVIQIVQTAVATRLASIAVHAQGYQTNPDVGTSLADGGRALVAALEHMPGVHVSPRVLGDGLAQSARHGARVALVGVIPEREARVSVVESSLAAGAVPQPTPSGVARQLPGALLGAALADELGVGIGEKIVLHAPGESGLGAFRVSGLYRTASRDFDRSTVFLRLEDAQRLLGVGDRVHELAIALDAPDQLAAVEARARAELPQVAPGERIEVLSWREREPRLAAILELMSSTAWVSYAAVFAGMAFGIANALLMSVYERIREFGVMRSLGLPARRLFALVLFESVLLTLGGAALGVALGVAIVLSLAHSGVSLGSFADTLGQLGVGPRVYPRLEAGDWIWPLGLAFATAVVAAAWPAAKAARLRPAEAVRHV